MVIFEIFKFIIFCTIIVLISKYVLVSVLRKLSENLNLEARVVGDVAGFATSMPELLTICASSFNGLMTTSVMNVISSNVINLIQYLLSIFINKNQKYLKNTALKFDVFIVVITIFIPIILFILNVNIGIGFSIIFIFIYIILKNLNKNAHKLYLKKEEKIIEQEIENEERNIRNKNIKTIMYFTVLIFIGVILYIISNRLGNTINILCRTFHISEWIIGVILGGITSLPELITFFESQKYHKSGENSIIGVVEATNNLLTSNMLNLFIIQSIGVIIFYFFAA